MYYEIMGLFLSTCCLMHDGFLSSSFVPAETLLLGFQHYIVMLGTTVMIPSYLVPRMGGNDVCVVSLYHIRSFSHFLS
jgi:hypothetical protein